MGVIKRIGKDVEVSIVNARHGGFYYESPRQEVVIDLEDFGSEDYVTFGDLKSMNSKTNFLKNLTLIITEVLDEDVSIEDVVKSLKIQDSYSELLSLGEDKLETVEYIDVNLFNEFVKEADIDEIDRILNSEKSMVRYSVQEAATYMYKEGELADFNKMTSVAEKSGHKDVQKFWKDIDSSRI